MTFVDSLSLCFETVVVPNMSRQYTLPDMLFLLGSLFSSVRATLVFLEIYLVNFGGATYRQYVTAAAAAFLLLFNTLQLDGLVISKSLDFCIPY
jgi:hypothetical protein